MGEVVVWRRRGGMWEKKNIIFAFCLFILVFKIFVASFLEQLFCNGTKHGKGEDGIEEEQSTRIYYAGGNLSVDTWTRTFVSQAIKKNECSIKLLRPRLLIHTRQFCAFFILKVYINIFFTWYSFILQYQLKTPHIKFYIILIVAG